MKLRLKLITEKFIPHDDNITREHDASLQLRIMFWRFSVVLIANKQDHLQGFGDLVGRYIPDAIEPLDNLLIRLQGDQSLMTPNWSLQNLHQHAKLPHLINLLTVTHRYSYNHSGNHQSCPAQTSDTCQWQGFYFLLKFITALSLL